jgi:hypothetical protein
MVLLLVSPSAEQLPLEPPSKNFGQSVWPVYEGWYRNLDGSYTLLVGYFNPNAEETFDVPIGESNHFMPGDPDRGQPTHFTNGRGWGVFTVNVPADFGGQQLRWVITTNNRTQEVPMHLDPQWYVEPFEDAANKNRPPTLRFESDGEAFEGPPSKVAATYSATVNQPLDVNLWIADTKPTGYESTVTTSLQRSSQQRPGLVLRWSKLSGPGIATFESQRQEFDESDQEPTNSITFSEPGDYRLRVEALDESGSGGTGSQCCWTSAHVKVNVGVE